MSLEAIVSHILNQANAQKELIIQQAQKEAAQIIQEAQKEAEILYQDIIGKAKVDYENQRQRLIVHAHLEYKKSLLVAKQELIDSVFKKLKLTIKSDKFKKQQIFADKVLETPVDLDFYFERYRQDYEIEIAKVLFK